MNKLKKKNDEIISMGRERGFWQTPTCITDKNAQQARIRRECPQHGKKLYEKLQITSYLTGKDFPLRSGIKQEWTLIPLLFNILLEFLAFATQ